MHASSLPSFPLTHFNMQLKALYLHNNRINTLKGSLKFLRHIEMLSLQNNRLTDLEAR